MRMSMNQDDPGYRVRRGLPRSVRPVVLLDGERVSRCITADTKRGFVLVHVVNQDGKVQINAKRTDTKKERRYGRVEIVLVRRAK